MKRYSGSRIAMYLDDHDDWLQAEEKSRFGYAPLAGPGFATAAGTASKPRCYDGHAPLPLGRGLVIHGGSCLCPSVTDADVYIGFDAGMKLTPRHWPWTPGHEVRFPIHDMDAPADVAAFMALLAWTRRQLEAGLKVHAGCIGGHGRTGTFFAALVKGMLGEADAIGYVRQHYCRHAVESDVQQNFLVQQFGIVRTLASKGNARSTRTLPRIAAPDTKAPAGIGVPQQAVPRDDGPTPLRRRVDPTRGPGSVWG